MVQMEYQETQVLQVQVQQVVLQVQVELVVQPELQVQRVLLVIQD
jgi:hypothetical protein